MASITTGQRLDKQANLRWMTKTSANPGTAGRQFEQLRQSLARIGYISQGSVQDRTGRKGGGAGYQWTRKVAQKTITLALTPEQFVELKQAIQNYRLLRRSLTQMERLSRKIIFEKHPHPARRKHLSRKVLGTI